jgi:hypothetical protein
MAHVFDTGLAKPMRTLIRDALVAQLAPLLKSATPAKYLRAITTIARPYRGQGDEEGLGMIANALLGRAPAVAIALGRLPTERAGSLPTEMKGDLDVVLYVVSEHGRDLEEGRLYGDAIATGDDTADPGIWTMLEHVRERVAGQSLGIAGVDEPIHDLEDEALTAANATVWEQRYTIGVSIVLNPARDNDQMLLEIEGHHQVEGSEDGPPDLDPLITLAELEEP